MGPDYVAQSHISDQEGTWNFYPERNESPGAAAQYVLYPTPGVEQIALASGSPGTAHFFQNGREFAVIGTVFYEIDQAGTLTNRGSLATNDNPATISSNGDGGGQLLITSGGNGYVYDLNTDTLSSVAFLAGKATMGDFIDGYFLVLDASTSTLYVSDLLDGTTWDPTQFAQRTIASDLWVSMKVLNRFIYLLGSQTSEVWYDTGSFPFPFAPHPSGLFQFGCAAPFSPEVMAGTLVWIGATEAGDGAILRISGFTPEVISTPPVQYAINNYDTIADAVSDSYEDAGHTFYLASFPSADATWCWDSKTQLWHRRGTWNAMDGEFGILRPRYHAFAFGEHRILDSQSGQLLRMSSALGTDVDDIPLVRERRAPALIYENRRMYFSLFELLLESGVGLVSGQGSDPLVMLSCSNDGGHTWSVELTRSAGEIGQYNARQRWLRMGSGRRRVFRVRVSDPVPWRIIDAFIEVANAPQQERRSAA